MYKRQEYILKISNLISELRSSGVNVSVYPDSNKLSKQFTYSDKNNFNYALIFGESERERNCIKIRNLKSGSESNFGFENFIKNFKG